MAIRTSYVSPPWWPAYPPHAKQALALWGYERVPELLYGGAAGGGKSDYLLMAASQFCGYGDYSALLIRRTYQELSLPGALMDRAIKWWAGKYGIRWQHSAHRMTWPSGATIQFGHLGGSTDHERYQGAEFHFVGFDEATQVPAHQLQYLHSRLRRQADSPIPIRYRLASNPGSISHEFVRNEYVKGADGRTRIYLPALLSENPGLDQEAYRERLSKLDPITRKQLEEGDWDVVLSAGFFEVEHVGSFTLQDMSMHSGVPMVRAWDLAATPDAPGTDPDWTVGILMALVDGEAWVLDMKRARLGPARVERLIRETAEADGHDIRILIEREPGSSGLLVHRHMAAQVLNGFDYHSKRASGSKYDRAKPLAAAVSNGLFRWLQDGEGRNDAMAEMRAFNDDPKTYAHDDIVDALSLAFNDLTRAQRRRGGGMAAGVA